MRNINRRLYLKSTVLAGALTMTKSSFSSIHYPTSELVGKKRPELMGDGFNLRQSAAKAFDQMKADALKVGIDIYSVSSFRSYEHQKSIWNRKYNLGLQSGKNPSAIVLDIVKYSTIPGTSRHHWGTDLDMMDLKPPKPASVLLAEHYQPGGAFENLYQWLCENANAYGFYEVYTNDKNRTGFHYEPWHWSYLPLAKPMLEQYLKMDWQDEINSEGLLGYDAIKEFLPEYKKGWILGVDSVALP